jgi:hypothetical protein
VNKFYEKAIYKTENNCRVAGFPTCGCPTRFLRSADKNVGDTADRNVCATLAAPSSPTRDYANNFQSIIFAQLAFGEFRRSNRLAVVFDHDTAWKKVLRHQELLEGARQLGGHFFAIRDDGNTSRGFIHRFASI